MLVLTWNASAFAQVAGAPAPDPAAREVAASATRQGHADASVVVLAVRGDPVDVARLQALLRAELGRDVLLGHERRARAVFGVITLAYHRDAAELSVAWDSGGQCPLRSYILSITVRSARQHLRSAKRRRLLEARAAAPPGALDTPDVDTERRELAALLNQALDALPLGQRAAFILCEVEERSSVEAAQILGEKPGTLRARVFHAKRKLRQQLEKLAPEGTHPLPVEP